MFTICLTALIKPYGRVKALHYLDIGLLMALWLTLWAASVFSTHPRCEDGTGGIIGWCEGLSLAIGVLDGGCVVLFVLIIVYYKIECTKKEKNLPGIATQQDEVEMTSVSVLEEKNGQQCSNESESKTMVNNPMKRSHGSGVKKKKAEETPPGSVGDAIKFMPEF